MSLPKPPHPHRSWKVLLFLICLSPLFLGVCVFLARDWSGLHFVRQSRNKPIAPEQRDRAVKPKEFLQIGSTAKSPLRSDLLEVLRPKSIDYEAQLRIPIPKPRTEEEFEGDVEERQQWFISQRMFPFDELPDQARRNAWEARPADFYSSLVYSKESLVASQWQPIGPLPTNSYFPNNWGKTSGRINAIAVSPADPNILLIGAATGGIWRSTDAGTTFSPVSDSQVDLAVGSIDFAPSNPSIAYAGMGDKAQYLGTGVLKSTDSGQTWTRVSNGTLPSPGRISQILVDPTNPNRVYVAQYVTSQNFASGFYYSTDGGVNWTKTIGGAARDLVRHPTQSNILYLAMDFADAANGSTGGVFKSSNSGQTWTRVYSTPGGGNSANIKIAVTPAAPQNLYVLVGKSTAQVEVSTNEGGSWANRGSNFDVGQFGYNCYLFVHPTSPNTIYVGTRDLWRSTNGGSTYTNITNNFSVSGAYSPNSAKSHPDQHHFYISPSNPNTIYIANDGGLWKSTNGAGTFTSLNSTLGLTMFTSYDLHPTDASRSYGGTQDNGTQKRTGAQAWREFMTGDGGQTFVDALDPSIVYTTYVAHTIYRLNNHGETFGAEIGNAGKFGNDRVAFYPPFVGNEANSNLYFGTYRLYVSTNRGTSWTVPGGGTDLTFGGVLSAIAVSRTNTNVIYTGASDGRVMVSINGGTNWTDRTAGLPVRFIKSISVSATDPNTAYLTVSGFGSGHVFKTTNAGASWMNISGNLPDIPTNTLLVDPRPGNSNTLYVGTDIGVFRSTVGGLTWETFNNGLPPTIVSELDGQPSGLMHVGTYGRGAFEINLSDSSGTTLQYSLASYSVSENTGTSTITVTRSGSTAGASSVTFATSNGTATAGQDYATTSGTLSFASGETSKTYNIPILDDSLVEGNETINLILSSPSGATLGSPSTAVLTIADNENNCSYTLSPTSQNFGASAGNGAFSVTSPSGCSWTAASNANWLTTTSSGSGNGTVNFEVAANTGAARSGAITVAGQTFTVNQSAGGGGCPSTAISPGQTINGTLTTSDCVFVGTTRYVDVYNFSGTAGQQIAVSMNSSIFDTYLYLLNPSNQTITENDDGGGNTNSRIPASTGFFTLPATGSYTIYATSFSNDGTTGSTGAYTITLSSASCSYALNPTSQSFAASGGNGSFGVTTPAGCAWAASSNANWLTTTSSGLGNGSVSFAVAANTGAARSGAITVGVQTFTVNQNAGGGGCPSTAISPGQTINSTLTSSDCFFVGTTRYVDVYTINGTAGQQIAVSMNSSVFDTYLYLLDASNQTIMQDDDGGGNTNSRIPASAGFFTLPATGGYTIYATSFSLDGTTGSTGAYSISVFGLTNCSYALSPTSQSLAASGGSGSFAVTTSAGCAWAAASNTNWITTNSGDSGSGEVGYIVAGNTGAERSGTITVAGQIFTVNQAAGGGGCPSTSASVGQAMNGTLTTADCIFSGTTRYVDVYNFSGTAGQQIALSMGSSIFDTYLYLVNASNQVIAEDDDGGGGTNSRFPAGSGFFTLPSTGSYSIYATSYSQFGTTGSTGAYTLTLIGSTSPSVQLSSSNYNVGEGNGSVQVTVTRTDTSGTATVDYATSDNAGLSECNVFNGTASSRCDIATSIGTLRFAAGEGSKNIFIPIVDDSYAEGNEAFTLTLSNPTGMTLGSIIIASITIQDNETVNGINPVDGVDFFIRQNYIDFLGREPDPAGLAGWRNVLVNCGTTIAPPCDRTEVSAGFFRSEEFQSRGYFSYRFYSSVGRIPLSNEFFPDFAKVSGFLTVDQLEANKVAFVNEFMARAEFQTKYSSTFSNPTAYVDALLLTVGLPTHSGRAGWIATLNANNNSQTRALVLRQLVESSEVYNKYFNEAFVIMQYFGYLRRTADASYLSWIQTMNQNGGDYRTMINGFLNSAEYRRRFGP
ncbi:MAG: Calx-beta domain-containing protein [Acidobacteriota bacterium]